jgi:malate dehydrogenase (oxaloacetate-decarboxylating)
MGAAGTAITKILLRAGARDIIVCDRQGIIYEGNRADLNESKVWLAIHTNPRRIQGSVEDALKKANAFIGVSGAGLLTR